jgi:hypothetical protein
MKSSHFYQQLCILGCSKVHSKEECPDIFQETKLVSKIHKSLRQWCHVSFLTRNKSRPLELFLIQRMGWKVSFLPKEANADDYKILAGLFLRHFNTIINMFFWLVIHIIA